MTIPSPKEARQYIEKHRPECLTSTMVTNTLEKISQFILDNWNGQRNLDISSIMSGVSFHVREQVRVELEYKGWELEYHSDQRDNTSWWILKAK